MIEAFSKSLIITVESSNIPCLTRKVDIITKNLLIINASGDLKKTWLLINQLRRKQRRTLKAANIIDNKRIIERKVIANEFKKYFVSLPSKLYDEVKISRR